MREDGWTLATQSKMNVTANYVLLRPEIYFIYVGFSFLSRFVFFFHSFLGALFLCLSKEKIKFILAVLLC